MHEHLTDKLDIQQDYELSCKVNSKKVTMDTAPTAKLVSIIRDQLQLTGTKKACEIGRCGSCMVILDGKLVNSCLTMAYQCSGKEIMTIEGLTEANELTRIVQQAFLEEGGYQCGYCTPGMIVSVTALLMKDADPSKDEIGEALSGNLCRCTGYGGICRAVHRAIEMRREHVEHGTSESDV